jgi:hypothetical protein
VFALKGDGWWLEPSRQSRGRCEGSPILKRPRAALQRAGPQSQRAAFANARNNSVRRAFVGQALIELGACATKYGE